MKRILGLDLGTNSIGWALVQNNFNDKEGKIEGLGSRIIPMSQDILGKFDSGVTISQTAERTNYRGVRRLYQRDNLRRERLHRVLNILGFLPQHYAKDIDFEDRLGQFIPETETKLSYRKDENGKHQFIFQDSFNEMVEEFKVAGHDIKLPYDWTIFYLRKKALTQKINKEELAWILLNFNQKRGYYQARGEGEELDEGKIKEFVQLKVKDVIDSGEEVKGNKLHDILFENGWYYDKQITKTEDWIGKTREFIVTQTKQKDGSVKRTYKKVDSEKDWIAIKEKSQQDIDIFNRTNNTVGIGHYIFNALLENPNQKIRGKLIKTIERKYYHSELKAILDNQVSKHPELQDIKLYSDCINELYRHNEAHKKNIKDIGFKYLLLDDIIFYQRPLKSKRSTISNCPYETRFFIKDGKKQIQPIKCISKSNPLYQEFRLWQFIHNLKIYEREIKIGDNILLNYDVTNLYLKSQEDFANLFDFLCNKAEINQFALLRYFKLSDKTHRWNYVEDKKYPCNETRSEFIKRLSKMDGLKIKETLTPLFENELWHLIYSVKDIKQYVQALKTFAAKKSLEVESFVENFEKFKPYDTTYGSYSEKAIKKLLPLMRRGCYWKLDTIPVDVKNRINSIMERVKHVGIEWEGVEKLADDDIPKQLLKSFVKAKDPFQGLNTYQACYAVYNRHSEVSDIQQWRKPEDITWYLNPKNPKGFKQHSLRNPIVEQVVTETLRVVKDVWDYYGKGEEYFFDEIHVELGREMKNDKKTRERISKSINDNENTNERIKNILKELIDDTDIDGDIRPYSKGQQDILKLYEEGVYANSEDTYKTIKLDDIDKIRKNNTPTKSEITKYKLWLEQGYISPYTGAPIPLSRLFTTDYQIEHIIPRSRYFDDSMGNKIICESEVNAIKDNQTALEFIKNNPDRIVDLGQGKQATLFTIEAFEEHCKVYFKGNSKKLKILLSEDIPNSFISRQLNDSRYISKVVMGLLSNVVREDGEKEVTSKNLIPVMGSITSKMKNDWGLNDVWETLIAPRFDRMNQITETTDFRKQTTDGNGNTYWINTVPDELAKGFSKKRIDHRHHALDALVIALASRNHVTYLGNLNANEYDKRQDLKRVLCFKTRPDANGNYKWQFHKPWPNLTENTLERLSVTVVSFKQNQRIINKTNNKYLRWERVDGQWKKVLEKQKRRNWAIRKSLHKATYYGKIEGYNPPKGKITTATRKDLSEITNDRQLETITDTGIQKILRNHLQNYLDEKGKAKFDIAFSPGGIIELNKNIQELNEGKRHQTIKKVRLFTHNKMFAIGETGINSKKYVTADEGTNLFFNVYWNEKLKKRNYETVPLEVVAEHQKSVADHPKENRTKSPINIELGRFLFSLSPDDLVYVPNDEEIGHPHLVDFKNLTKEQVNQIYKFVDGSGTTGNFIPAMSASLIANFNNKEGRISFSRRNSIPEKELIKNEFGLGSPQLKNQNTLEGIQVKSRCWKLSIDRLGNLKRQA